MAQEKAVNFRNLTEVELERRLAALGEERFNLRFRNSMKQLENPLLIRENRRIIARVKTVLAEKRRAAQTPVAK